MSTQKGESPDLTDATTEPVEKTEERPPLSFEARQSTRRNGTAVACVGCMSAIVLGVLASILLFAVFSKDGRMPEALRQGEVMECSNHLTQLVAALGRYETKKDLYPDKLADLYPDFLNSSGTLYCPSDAARKGSTSYEYIRPAIDAGPATIVMRCKWHSTPRIKLTLEANLKGEVDRLYQNPRRSAKARLSGDGK